MNISQGDVKKILKLKKDLPPKAQKMIAQRLGKKQSYVSAVLNGKFWNEEVVSEAVKYLEECKEKKVQLMEKIMQIITY